MRGSGPMRDQHSTIAIVGGGFSGAVLATQLLRRDRASLRVVVIERLSQPGRGLAYSMQYNWHLLNVPAGKMSAFPDEPEHFLRWAQRNYDRAAAPGSFLPRRVYGQYVHAVLRETQAGSASRLHWLHDEVTQLRPAGAKTELMLRSGERVVADKVVLAFGNLPASDPALPGRRPDSGRYFRHAWSANALEGVEGEQDVLLIGAGWTAVDMVIALRARGFTGRVHMLSRRGLLAHPHKATREWPLYWDENSPRTVR